MWVGEKGGEGEWRARDGERIVDLQLTLKLSAHFRFSVVNRTDCWPPPKTMSFGVLLLSLARSLVCSRPGLVTTTTMATTRYEVAINNQ